MNKDQVLVEYLRRSYTAADGLWFMIVEEAHDFEHALALDEKVWQILPKIQVRKAREVLGITGNSLADLTACFSLKLRADGHLFRVDGSARRCGVRCHPLQGRQTTARSLREWQAALY